MTMQRAVFAMILGIAIILGVGLWYLQGAQKPTASTNDPASGAHVVYGSADAPVTIVEFSNYLCPHCKHHAELSLPLIFKNYVNTGKVRYIFRDLPFPNQLNVELAAQAADCAFEQGKYLEYHEVLFRAGEQWGRVALDKLPQYFDDYASQLGLDVGRFGRCLAEGKTKPWVEADKALAEKLNVNGTPSFFVNGKFIEGFRTFEEWEEIINNAIKNSP